MDQPDLYNKINAQMNNDSYSALCKYSGLLKWKDDSCILDIGTGDGKFLLERLVPHVPIKFRKLVCSDVSEIMVNFARKRCKEPKIEFEVLDIGAKSVPSKFIEAFDNIFSFICLQWVEDIRQAYRNIYDMLKPEGVILLTFLRQNPFVSAYQTLAKNPKWRPYVHNGHISRYHTSDTPELAVQQDLSELGFEVYDCLMEKKFFLFVDYQTFRDFCISINPDVSKIPAEYTNEYLEDYMNAVMDLDAIHMKSNSEKQWYYYQHDQISVVAAKLSHRNGKGLVLDRT